MGLKIPLSLLQAFRPVANPRNSKSSRMILGEGEKVLLSRCVWVQEDGEVYSNSSGLMVRLPQRKMGVYSSVRLSLAPGKRHSFLVARLVLFAWHSERLITRCREAAAAGDTEYLYPDDYEAGHIDDDPDNNFAHNIEPVTQIENLRQSHARPERRTSGLAQSRPVVVAEVLASASAQARAFPVGHVFSSSQEAARQTGISSANICTGAKKGRFRNGVRFESGVLESDRDPPGRLWFPSLESGKWCHTFGGLGIRTSSDGWIWTKTGSIKSRGWMPPGTIYHLTRVGGKNYRVHVLVLRCGNGAFDEHGEWVAQEVPKDEDGKNLMCLHGGPGRASDAERRADGYERNHLADLRWGTSQENAADAAHERASRARVV